MSEKLDRMKDQKEKAEQKLRYYQHQEKMLEHRIPELTRKARTHRLCTRGGMLESFLICPGELTDDQVMKLLKLSFRQQEVALALAKMIRKRLTKQRTCQTRSPSERIIPCNGRVILRAVSKIHGHSEKIH